jgi:hypothetical protein
LSEWGRGHVPTAVAFASIDWKSFFDRRPSLCTAVRTAAGYRRGGSEISEEEDEMRTQKKIGLAKNTSVKVSVQKGLLVHERQQQAGG